MKAKKGRAGLKLVMAGGGTGGHLFPAIALAEELKARGEGIEIVFIGGKGGIEERVVPKYGYELELLDVEALKKKSGFARIRSIYKAAIATFRSIALLRRIGADGVIGSGSYSSGPVVLAAKLIGLKTAILEQNVLPGLTNKFLGRYVNRVYVAFDKAAGYFPKARVKVSGTPIRREIVVASIDKELKKREKFNVMVFGGSQGAAAINAAFLDATDYLSDIWNDVSVTHQSGCEHFEAISSAYERKGLDVDLQEFIDDMGEAYAEADLVVCRAGATTIAEITAGGLPAILVPYPFASDNHQEVNARHLEEKGAAIVIVQDDLTGNSLAQSIRGLYEDRTKLKIVAEEAKKLGMGDAAKFIADDFLAVLIGNA